MKIKDTTQSNTYNFRVRILLATVVVFLFSATLLATAKHPLADDNELELSVARMAKVGSASSPTFSPDGSRLAFVTNISGLPQVWTMATAGGYPSLVTSFDDPVGFVTWSPDGQWLAASGESFTIHVWPVPDVSKPLLHRRSHDDLLALLRTHTNLVALPDPASSSGYKLEAGPFGGWAMLPEW